MKNTIIILFVIIVMLALILAAWRYPLPSQILATILLAMPIFYTTSELRDMARGLLDTRDESFNIIVLIVCLCLVAGNWWKFAWIGQLISSFMIFLGCVICAIATTNKNNPSPN